MNRVCLIGRLTKDVELAYAKSDPSKAIARFTLAVERKFEKDKADFIKCVAFGKTGEFASKYFSKGLRVAVIGSLRIDEKDGKYYTSVVVDEVEFADGKAEKKNVMDGFTDIESNDSSDELPFE